jgi:hypothetical protein
MSVMSILSRLKFDVKYLIPFIFLGVLLKSVSSNSPVSQSIDDPSAKVEKLPFCDDKLINDRGISKR